MNNWLLRGSTAVAAGILALGGSLGTAYAETTASADAPRYAALGDSFSAGVGTGSPATSCFQSPEGYPALIANATGWDLDYLACSGATISGIAAQVDQLEPGTDYITVTAGGNDVGFSNVLLACALQPDEACAAAVAYAESIAASPQFAAGLAGLFGKINLAAPDATVVVVGYPNLFKHDDCLDGQAFTRAEFKLLNQATDRLNAVIKAQAEAAGLVFADPTPAFKGHASCARVPYVNGLTDQVALFELFHPNDAGQVAYARVVARQFGVNGIVTRATAGN
ncbi:SGNH/GDSL hydrolase family protein [Granulicoccus sp. GXG6511]|uniref:SGNH/GDSL hydrolase family protein n=1 Tax=Granulicoccus sp. GXG6511 TaxID=3381351 RepID=UPI003D7D8982